MGWYNDQVILDIERKISETRKTLTRLLLWHNRIKEQLSHNQEDINLLNNFNYTGDMIEDLKLKYRQLRKELRKHTEFNYVDKLSKCNICDDNILDEYLLAEILD